MVSARSRVRTSLVGEPHLPLICTVRPFIGVSGQFITSRGPSCSNMAFLLSKKKAAAWQFNGPWRAILSSGSSLGEVSPSCRGSHGKEGAQKVGEKEETYMAFKGKLQTQHVIPNNPSKY